MTGWALMLRARRTWSALTAMGALAVAERLLINERILISRGFDISLPWAVILPMATAAIVGTAARSQAAQLESGTVRSLPALRLAHLALIGSAAAASTWWASSPLTGPYTEVAALRNLVGFTGLALIAAAAIGGDLAWTLPTAFGLTATVAGTHLGVARGWAWPVHDDSGMLAAVLAAGLLGAGLAAAAALGSREHRA